MVDRTRIPTVSKEIEHLNILKVVVGSTGRKGGDAGHGGRSVVRIENLASTAWAIRYQCNNGVVRTEHGIKFFEVHFAGDAELGTMAEAFAFAAAQLRRYQEEDSLEPDETITSAI